MFILTDRQKNKPFQGEPLERKKSATLGDNGQGQLIFEYKLGKMTFTESWVTLRKQMALTV